MIGQTFVVDSKYEFIKQIGHGAYGFVVSAINKKTNQKVAIKKVIFYKTKGRQRFRGFSWCKENRERNQTAKWGLPLKF